MNPLLIAELPFAMASHLAKAQAGFRFTLGPCAARCRPQSNTFMKGVIPSHLVNGLTAALRFSATRRGDPLHLAWEILKQLGSGMGLSLHSIAFRFDGGLTPSSIEVGAILCEDGRIVLELDRLLKVQIGTEYQMEEGLVEAARCFLDRHLPAWLAPPGAFGVLRLAVDKETGASSIMGRALVRTIEVQTIDFPRVA